MRVIFLAHAFPREIGDAAGSFILRLAVALQADGATVRVLAPAAAGLAARERIEGVDVTRYRYAPVGRETLAYTGTMAADVRGSWPARAALVGLVGAAAWALRRARAAGGVDVVHAHWWFPGALSAALPGAAGDVPIVATLHGSDVRLARGSAAGRGLYARVADRASALTAVSRYLCERAGEMAPDVPCEVAPMPVATHLFSPDGNSTRSGIVFVGRLNDQKGLDALLRAVALLTSAPTVTVVGDGPAKAELHALAAQLGIADRVRWREPMAQHELAGVYRGATTLVVPSVEEGLGLVAAEAMLCETPVVAFASGGLPDIVAHGRNGLLVPPGDVQALARAIDSMLRGNLATLMGRTARSDVLATFAPDVVARRYRGIYERVVGHGP